MSGHKSSKPIKPETGIRVGTFGHRSVRQWLGRVPKKVALIAGLVIVVLIVGGVGLLALHPHKSQQVAVTPPKTAEQKINETTESITNAFFANDERTDQTLQAAQNQLTSLAQQAKTADQKQQVVSASINLYSQAGKPDQALAEALANDTASKTALSAAIVGGVYNDVGDYANAAKYYQTAADRSPKTAATERSAYNDYLIMQRQMEAKL